MTKRLMMRRGFNLISFNLIWVLAIIKGNQALPLIGILIALHFMIINYRVSELKVVICTALLGYSVDCLLTLFGFFKFSQVQGITPIWLLALWIGFSTTLRHSLQYFSNKPLVSALCGAIAGSASYFMAAHLGAVVLAISQLISVIVLALVWAVLFPCLMLISQRLGGDDVS